MLGIGATELFVVAALALMLFSPRELPNILRSVMKFWGSIKRTADDFKDAIMQEEAMQELREAYKGGKDIVRKAETDARRDLMKARAEVRKAQGKLAKATQIREKRTQPRGGAEPVAQRPATPSSDPRQPAVEPDEPEAAEAEPEPSAAKPAAPATPAPANEPAKESASQGVV